MKVKIVGDYEIHHTLGEGSFGKVKYAIKRSSGEALAIKVSNLVRHALDWNRSDILISINGNI